MGNHRPLTRRKMAPNQVLADDPLKRTSFAVPLYEARLDACHRTGKIPISPVKNLAFVEDDVVQ